MVFALGSSDKGIDQRLIPTILCLLLTIIIVIHCYSDFQYSCYYYYYYYSYDDVYHYYYCSPVVVAIVCFGICFTTFSCHHQYKYHASWLRVDNGTQKITCISGYAVMICHDMILLIYYPCIIHILLVLSFLIRSLMY